MSTKHEEGETPMFKTSFLSAKLGSTYDFLLDGRYLAGIYTIILCIVIPFSLFFQWMILQFIIDLLLGWTILSIPYVLILMVTFDKQVKSAESYEDELAYLNKHGERNPNPKHTTAAFQWTKVWAICMLFMGIALLYYSGKYKEYYNFQCTTFYVDDAHHTYHYYSSCTHFNDEEYMEENDDEEYMDEDNEDGCEDYEDDTVSSIFWGSCKPDNDDKHTDYAAYRNYDDPNPKTYRQVLGADLLKEPMELCIYCEERAEDIHMEMDVRAWRR